MKSSLLGIRQTSWPWQASWHRAAREITFVRPLLGFRPNSAARGTAYPSQSVPAQNGWGQVSSFDIYIAWEATMSWAVQDLCRPYNSCIREPLPFRACARVEVM